MEADAHVVSGRAATQPAHLHRGRGFFEPTVLRRRAPGRRAELHSLRRRVQPGYRHLDASAGYASRPNGPRRRGIGNHLYVLSGATDPGWNFQDPSCYRLNLASPVAWERIADIPVGRRDFGTAVTGGSIYVIGGNIDEARSVMPDVHRYSPSSGAWTQVASMNVGRRYVATAGGGSAIAAFGASTIAG